MCTLHRVESRVGLQVSVLLMLVLLQCVGFVLWSTMRGANGDCNLSLQTDFPEPQAIYVSRDRLLGPTDAGGGLRVRRKQTITLSCLGDGRYLKVNNETTDLPSVDVRCSSGTTFTSDGLEWSGPLRELNCNRPSVYTAEYSGRGCYGGNGLIRVGYTVQRRFHQIYEACFDNRTLTTLYVMHVLAVGSSAHQRSKRAQFSAGNFFDGTPAVQAYKRKSQRVRFAEIFGEELADKYLTRNQFLNRGHLAARADFSLVSWQRVTFLLVNAAPQWSGNNQGNWETLESSVRLLTAERGRPLRVYTGTYGVSTLPDAAGEPRELYLHSDANNNPVLPVPMYYYKVLYDDADKLGIAFVAVNNPYYTRQQLQALVFCEDRCRDERAPRWLRWKPDDAKSGYAFCCSVGDFNDTVRHLPDMQIDGVFT